MVVSISSIPVLLVYLLFVESIIPQVVRYVFLKTLLFIFNPTGYNSLYHKELADLL
jgi:hypothetical protein